MTATHALLGRIAEALERLAPVPASATNLDTADAFVWHPAPPRLEPVVPISLPLELLKGIGPQLQTLLRNTTRFAAGLPGNNAMLWGARGMGKSSLVKAVHAACPPGRLALVEIARQDLPTLPALLSLLRASPRRFLLFCDDLSFDSGEDGYKALKSVLDGGITGRPDNVLFYATSNRRHLMAREMIENEQSTAIHGGETVDEKVSLSDRFGLWLGFHACDQATYLTMIEAYAAAIGLPLGPEALRAQALAWSAGRGARSGRVAAQFIADLAASLGQQDQGLCP